MNVEKLLESSRRSTLNFEVKVVPEREGALLGVEAVAVDRRGRGHGVQVLIRAQRLSPRAVSLGVLLPVKTE